MSDNITVSKADKPLKATETKKIELNKNLVAETSPKADDRQCISGNKFRLTVLTPELMRVEVSNENIFLDEATQSIWFRDFDLPVFSVDEDGDKLAVKTEKVTFYFNKKILQVTHVKFDGFGRKTKCDNRYNLKGTARTLDFSFGPKPLQDGIISKKGVAVLDDSKSLILDDDGIVRPRKHKGSDRYIFAYGKNYHKCFKDFFRLCGEVPLIPRFALGNWWSRYRAYTQEEYISLMKKFIREDVPITVATIDMDWHWVNINERYGTNYRSRFGQSEGWTGYSWNTELFPDYKAFLRWLKDHNYKVVLNLHPADGIRHYEDMHQEMAEELGFDPDKKEDIKFNIADPAFINAYLKILHHPYERDGVDFWWIDWQQGTKTDVKGLDPLWSLNHYHYLDNQKNKRPLILSRYAGVGSHRYPLGFSGDTSMNWAVFKFQPYFTATAANIGYTWWSHDIGGHHFGIKDDELYIRWLQFGVFSPVMRLHSTSNDLLGKEPWNFRKDVELFAKEQLRLRHRLIPYLYSINYRTHAEGIALVEPMYYKHPHEREAYRSNNQYYFGSELLVCPITGKIDKRLNMAFVDVWLPEGRWTDIFTGMIYSGGQRIKMFRGLETIPVLAKEGAVIPLGENKGNDYSNPEEMTLWVYRGNSSFTLYEDNGEDNNYRRGEYAQTVFSVEEDAGNNCLRFSIIRVTGDEKVKPKKRRYNILFRDIIKAEKLNVIINAKSINTENESDDDCLLITLKDVKPDDIVNIEISGYTVKENLSQYLAAVKIFTRYQAPNTYKIWQHKKLSVLSGKHFTRKLNKLLVPGVIKDAIREHGDNFRRVT